MAAIPSTSLHSARCWVSSSRRAFPTSGTGLYSLGKPADDPTLAPLIGGQIDVAVIHTYCTDIPHIVTALRAATVTASVIMRQLASHLQQKGVPAALREFGRMERTCSRWIGSKVPNCAARQGTS